MESIRQAVEYERLLSDARVKAHVELTAAELEAEKRLREMAIAYERKYTDGQFGQLQILADDHRTFHEREHLLYEDAIDKASASLTASLTAIQVDLDRLRDTSLNFLTTDRFEREHKALAEKTELALKVMSDKLGVEERVTVQQTTKNEVLEGLKANADTSRRWMIGLAVTSGLSLLALVLHLLKLY